MRIINPIFSLPFQVLALACVIAARTAAQSSDSIPAVTWLPARPEPGSIVQILIRRLPTGTDSIVRASGMLAGEPLHFDTAARGRFRALGGIPVDASDSVRAQLLIERMDGAIDSMVKVIPLALPAASPTRSSAERLRVAPRFGQEPDSALAARIEREAEMARAVSRGSHETPRLWRGSFFRPRPSRITSRFGGGREFNGVVRSRHFGVDFAGVTGAPVRVTNRGVVALVADFHLAGKAVYVDHGTGLVTAYFHLSRVMVAEGDTVVRAQVIGRVGQTGRVTGPHLHWVARYGQISVNALSLLTVDPVKRAPAPKTKRASGSSRTTSRKSVKP